MQELEGVVNIQDTHFWTLCTDVHYGTVVIEILEGSDSQKILSATRSIFTQVRQLHSLLPWHQLTCFVLGWG